MQQENTTGGVQMNLKQTAITTALAATAAGLIAHYSFKTNGTATVSAVIGGAIVGWLLDAGLQSSKN